MKKYMIVLLLMIVSVRASAQLKYVRDSFRSLSYQASGGDMGGGDITYEYLKAQWPTDDNGDPATLLIVKFKNMSPEESKRFTTFFSAGCLKAGEEFPGPDKHPDAYWLYLTSGSMIEITFNHPEYGACKAGPFVMAKEKIYEIVLENERTINLSFNSIPQGATVLYDGRFLGKTPCEKKDALYGKHKVVVQLDGIVREDEINITGDKSHFDYDMRKTHSMNISSDPSGAMLYVDGQSYGKLPQSSVILPYGPHTLIAVLDDIRDTVPFDIHERSTAAYEFKMVKKKEVTVYATYGGQKVNAYIDVDNTRVENAKTPYSLRLPYGSHDFRVSYAGQTKNKKFRVTKHGNSAYNIKIPTRNRVVWPWERDFESRPVGLSLGYVTKQWLTKGDGQKVKESVFRMDHRLHGVQAGLRVQPSFGLGFGLNTGIYYEFYYEHDSELEGTEYYDKFKEHSLYMPVHLAYRLPFSDTSAFYISGGIGMDCGVHAEFTATDVEDASETSYYGGDGGPKRFNLSAEVGIGLQIKGFQLNATYSKGLLDHEFYEGFKTRQNKISASISYVFGGN